MPMFSNRVAVPKRYPDPSHSVLSFCCHGNMAFARTNRSQAWHYFQNKKGVPKFFIGENIMTISSWNPF